MRCLVCNAPYAAEAHWPEAVGMGRNRRKVDLPTLPMCHACHMRQHAGHGPTIERLIRKAPMYWQATGEWQWAKPYYDRFLSRREYRACVR